MHYNIGEFSRMTSLSIKSLRLYHDKGILIPAQVDKFTGYRYYDDSNYEVARAIKILRTYDFSLAEIKEILSACEDERDMLDYLRSKVGEIHSKIYRYKEISRSIETIIQTERDSAMKPDQSFEIEEKDLDTILVAGYRMKGKYSDVGNGFSFLAKKMGRQINGKPTNLYYDFEYKEDDADLEPCYPVRKGKDTEGISVRELKGGKAVTLIHKGPYETIGESYKKILTYIHEKDYKSMGPHREVYVKGPGMILKGNPQNYLTEIQIMIQSKGS